MALFAVSGVAGTRSAQAQVPADTSGVPRPQQPALQADSSASDSTQADSLGIELIQRYLGGRDEHEAPAPSLLPRRQLPLMPELGSYWSHQVRLDSTETAYTASEQVGEQVVRAPMEVGYDTYRRQRMEAGLQSNWRDLIVQHERQRQRERGRGGLGVNIAVPGGRTSAFSTIFGKPQVDLRVNGQAQISAGFDYYSSDQQALVGRSQRVDPRFKQDLRLGITGSIGDKLRVNVDWDTNSQFDYQNQLKLDYTGYEDDIIQNVEAGNVFLQTSSSLINTGRKLFGIKSELQLGGVHLTTVASQEKGQSNSLSLEGGVQERTFDLLPIDYDERRHFFLAYHFRNWWEEALSDPPTIQVFQNFDRIIDIEVWRLERPDRNDQQRNVVALVDLGERPALLEQANGYTEPHLPSYNGGLLDDDQYSEQELEQIRNRTNLDSLLARQGLESSIDYQRGSFVKLEPQQDYEFNETLGYLSLNQRLQESQALAVAFKYQTADGTVHQVGDFVSDLGGSDNTATEKSLVLKLLRPTNLQSPSENGTFNPAAWYLEMRNIYPLRIRSNTLSPENFSLDVFYKPPGGTSQKTLPDVLGQQTLLQVLGLDRLTSNGVRESDNQVDIIPKQTIDPQNGLLIFPYLQPFGQHLDTLITTDDPDAPDELRSRYVLQSLYTEKKDNARDNTELDIYRITGSSKGTQPSFYDLGTYAGLVEGSVRVTAGGAPLSEGQDYVVDYQSGTVQITDPAYLTAGRQIEITYEQNQMFNIQKKTLLGARADYNLGDKLSLGATMMSLSESSPVDKFRVGEEPISNLIVGLDGALELEPRWLTWAVDALPFLQTKAPSAVSLTAEIAQLRPGHAQTSAFERSREWLQDNFNRDFNPDELRGISYIDDFEGFENTFSLKSPGAWRVAAPPDSTGRFPGTSVGGDSLRSNWRARMGWYQLNQSSLSTLRESARESGQDLKLTPATSLIRIQSLFPERPVRTAGQYLSTFDVYFNPFSRGPYNYTRDLQTFLNNPEDTWGGITMSLPDGYTDFELKNIEFVEFVFRPFPEGANDAGRNAVLYLELGSISEDVIPNDELNNEDGLALSDFSRANLDIWSRLPGSTQNNQLDLSDDNERTEDLGLDGLASYTNPSPGPSAFTEQGHYADFLNAIQAGSGSSACYQAELLKALEDPSGDDYHYFTDESFFGDPQKFPSACGAALQERFTYFFAGQELNGYEPQDVLGSGRGNSRYPDSEDLNLNSTVDTRNSYFQYRLPLSHAALDSLADNDNPDDFVVNEIESNGETGWYLIRIPVRKPDGTVGNSRDFSLIESIRMWTTGHHTPITLRFASMELVGSQWRKSDKVALDEQEETQVGSASDDTRLSISSINTEENGSQYEPPLGIVRKQARTATGLSRQFAREQALVLNVEHLNPGQQRAIYKTFNQGVDLLKYSNMRMFTHMSGQTAAGTPLNLLPEEQQRNKVELFVRLGANETRDYYEYVQPLAPSPPGTSGDSPQDLWLPENEVNIQMSALNQLKVIRDRQNAARDSVFWNGQRGATRIPLDFAPEGTQIGIKGTPSLGNISSIVIGVRNAQPNSSMAAENILRRAEVWVNELRVSGYDQSQGWAALANADIQLADFGQIRGNLRQQESGFGGLSSTLGDRQREDLNDWSFTTNVDAGQFIPEQYGWRIPLSVQLKNRTSTPEFAPSQGDVRVEEIINTIENSDSLSAGEQERLVQQTIRRAQTHRSNRSFTARLSKSNSESPWLQKTLDGLSLRYSYSDQDGRSPSLQLNDLWRWTGVLDYRFQTQPRTIRPFSFLQTVPLLGVLADLAWNYVPNEFALGADANRRYSATKDRPQGRLAASGLPPAVRYKMRDRQTFGHQRNFDLQYNPFSFLNLSLDTNTDQNMSAAAVDTLSSVIVLDATGAKRRLNNMTVAQAQAAGLVKASEEAYQVDSLNVLPLQRTFNRVFGDGEGMRTETYDQGFVATFSPSFSSIKWLDWIEPQDIAYQVNYDWNNGPEGRLTGATVGNRTSFGAGVRLKPQAFWRKFDFYKKLEQEQKQAEAEDASAQADSTDQGFDLPLPSLRSLFRQTVLAVTGVQDFNISYSGNRSATSTNVGRPTYREGRVTDVSEAYSLWDAFQGNAPSLRYRFGLDRRLSNDFRILDPNLQVRDELSDNNRLQARTTLSPTSNLQVDLNWNTQWNDRTTLTLNRTTGRNGTSLVQESASRGGTNRTSVWAFGASYLDLFERQYDTYLGDFVAGQDTMRDLNRDGRVVLSTNSVLEDFRRSFSYGFGTLGQHGRLPIPLPGWTVRYSGLSEWPLLSNLTQSVTLRHVYNATYNTDYRTNQTPPNTENTFELGPHRVGFPAPRFRSNAANINERFTPLIGMNVRWKKGLRTDLSWNRTNAYALQPGNKTISESNTDELSFNASYQQQGLSIPLLPIERLNNMVRFSLTASLSTHDNRRYILQEALSEVSRLENPSAYDIRQALEGEDKVSVLTGTTRFALTPKISYTFSDRVSADFTLQYEKLNSDDSSISSSTNLNGGFNVRVSISN